MMLNQKCKNTVAACIKISSDRLTCKLLRSLRYSKNVHKNMIRHLKLRPANHEEVAACVVDQ